jgi:hypothetical protein
MEDNRDDEVLLYVTLNAETMAHYAQRAAAVGRTVEDQLRYELKVHLGLALPDPGDRAATQHGQLFRRMSQGRILQG